jgi:triacylglycerol lipase
VLDDRLMSSPSAKSEGPPAPGPATYPIILAHGICRFDQWLNVTFGVDNQSDDRLHYFKRIRSTLIAHGFTVFHSRVGWADGVETRAEQLRDELIKHTKGFTRSAKVHIIAHSMGGLDARHMIYNYRLEERVASLTTIGTPHKGSSFADWGLPRINRVAKTLASLGLNVTGFEDLRTDACKVFNEKVEEFERGNGVKYQTYAGVQPRKRIFWPLRLLPYDIIEQREGPNDGLVSLESAKWRPEVFKGQIDADHLNEVGWCDLAEPGGLLHPGRFEARIRQFYVDVANGLATYNPL